MAEINTALAGALKQARKAPMHFAYVAKGAEGKLLVARKKIAAKEIAEARKEAGGGTVFRGRCVGEEGKLVFEVPKEPPGTLAKQLKSTITRDAGLTLQVETRVVADLEEEAEDQDAAASAVAVPAPDLAARFKARLQALSPALAQAQASTSPVSQQVKVSATEMLGLARQSDFVRASEVLDQVEALIRQVPPAPPPAQPATGDEAPLFKTRLKDLLPRIQQAQATNSPAAPQIKQRITEASTLARQNNFAAANALLDQIESLLAQGSTKAASPPPAPDGGAGFTAQLKALLPDIQKVQASNSTLSGEVKRRASEAQLFARQKNFSQANAVLAELAPVLKKALAGGAPDGASPAGKPQEVWQQARDQVDGQLNALYGQLRKTGIPELGTIADAIENTLKNYRVRLTVALTEFEQATGEAKEKARSRALQTVAAYQKEIPADKYVIGADTNPFGIKVNIRETLGRALQTLSQALSAKA
jgi:hypothetical protein